MITILGTNDAVNSCDCCGKANLKSTVIIDIDGEIFHYGSVCASRNTRIEAKAISKTLIALKKQVAKEEEDAYAKRLGSANSILAKSTLHTEHCAKIKEAFQKRLCGKEFKEFTYVDGLTELNAKLSFDFNVKELDLL